MFKEKILKFLIQYRVEILVLALIFAVYRILGIRLNLYNEDDIWQTSIAYNWLQHGINKDILFVSNPKLQIQYFGKIYSLWIFYILSQLSWTKANIFFINSIAIFLAAILWTRILKITQIVKSEHIFWAIVFSLIYPTIIYSGNSGRSDALVFFLVSAVILCVLRGQFFLAGLLQMIAIEIHPTALLSFIYIAGFLPWWIKFFSGSKSNTQKKILTYFLGITCGVIIYYLLHASDFNIDNIYYLFRENRKITNHWNIFIVNYFISRDWISHIHELVFLLFSLTVWKINWTHHRLRLSMRLLLYLLIASIILQRENRHYFIFAVPAILLFYYQLYVSIKKTKWLVIGLSAISLIYCSSHLIFNYRYDIDKTISSFSKHTKNNNKPIIALADFWLINKDTNYIAIHKNIDLTQSVLSDSFYFVQSDYLEPYSKTYPFAKAYIFENCHCGQIEKSNLGSNRLAVLWLCKNNL